MKVCLINPPWVTRPGNIWSKIRGTLPPLGLLYLAAFLEKAGVDTDVLDCQTGPRDWKDIEKTLREKRCEIYGVTGTTPIISGSYRVAELAKSLHPGSKVVMGGVHVTALPEEAAGKKFVDFVVRGEGEQALLDLARGCPPREIAGLSYKGDGRIVHVGGPGVMPDLDALPFPAFDKVDLRTYRPALGSYRRLPAISMMATRGCHGLCTFCNSAGVPPRRRSAENIYAEMMFLAKKRGIREISFYDDNFTGGQEEAERLCEMLISGGSDLSWSCFTRADAVSAPLLKKMKAAGCHQVMFGVESSSPAILANIRKEMAPERNREAVIEAKRAGLTARCAFMLGNPGETEATMEDTIRYSLELDPDIAIYNIATPYPGTGMFRAAKAAGGLLTVNWDDYDLGTPVMRLPAVPPETLKLKHKEAFRRFYLRPGRLIKNAFDTIVLRDMAGRLLRK